MEHGKLRKRRNGFCNCERWYFYNHTNISDSISRHFAPALGQNLVSDECCSCRILEKLKIKTVRLKYLMWMMNIYTNQNLYSGTRTAACNLQKHSRSTFALRWQLKFIPNYLKCVNSTQKKSIFLSIQCSQSSWIILCSRNDEIYYYVHRARAQLMSGRGAFTNYLPLNCIP